MSLIIIGGEVNYAQAEGVNWKIIFKGVHFKQSDEYTTDKRGLDVRHDKRNSITTTTTPTADLTKTIHHQDPPQPPHFPLNGPSWIPIFFLFLKAQRIFHLRLKDPCEG